MTDNFITDESAPHHFRTELPNLIGDLGLSPALIGIYFALKKAAGDNGSCIKSNKTLSKELNITRKTLIKLVYQLAEINPILDKPLIKIEKRMSKDGDSDTNLITIANIWPENYKKFSSFGGGVKITPPSVKITQGVVQNLHQGSVNFTHKQEPLKKNPINKKTTTTKSPSSSQGRCRRSSEEISKDAQKIKQFLDKEAVRERDSHEFGKYELGNEWILSLDFLEKLLTYENYDYVCDQINYVLNQKLRYMKNGKTKEVNDVKTYINIACEKNYAKHQNKEK